MDRGTTVVWILLLALTLCLAGCTSEKAPEDETPTVSTPAPSAAVDPDEPDAEEGQTEETPIDIEPDELAGDTPQDAPVSSPEPQPTRAFQRASVTLAELDSYRYKTTFAFVEEESGRTESGSMELSGIIAGPRTRHLSWVDLSTGETFEIIQMGDQTWVYEDGGWEPVPSFAAEAMSQVALVYAPSATWNGLFGAFEPDAVYVGTETVHGVRADHFRATYEQWGAYWEGELVDATGDIWIAEAGYPVRYHFSATGIDEDGNRGTVTWTMDLTDVNDPSLTVPAIPEDE